MPTKTTSNIGRKIDGYNTCDISEALFENLKEGGEYPEKTDDELRSMVYDDHDAFTWAWDDFKERITETMKKKNPSGYWKVEGRSMGWRSLSGHKYVNADDALTLFRAILPETDLTLAVFNYGKGIAIRCSHHDAPMGEMYYITPCAASTYEKNV